MHPCDLTMGIVTVASLVTRVGSGAGVTMTSILRHQFGRERGEAIFFPLRVDTQRQCFSPSYTPAHADPGGMPRCGLNWRKGIDYLGILSVGLSPAAVPRPDS